MKNMPAEAEPEEIGVQSCGLNVLVVDDDDDYAQSTAILLRLYGHKVQTACRASDALSVVLAQQFDVVILDIGLPGMSGYDFAKRLKGQHPLPLPFLIAISGYGGDEVKQKTAECGIDLHFVKPLDPAYLKKLLEGLRPRSISITPPRGT